MYFTISMLSFPRIQIIERTPRKLLYSQSCWSSYAACLLQRAHFSISGSHSRVAQRCKHFLLCFRYLRFCVGTIIRKVNIIIKTKTRACSHSPNYREQSSYSTKKFAVFILLREHRFVTQFLYFIEKQTEWAIRAALRASEALKALIDMGITSVKVSLVALKRFLKLKSIQGITENSRNNSGE